MVQKNGIGNFVNSKYMCHTVGVKYDSSGNPIRDSRYNDELIKNEFEMNVSQSLDEIRPNYAFDMTAMGSVPQAIRCFLESNSWESAVRLAVSMGGDADTMACIAGGIAEAYYKNK